MNDQETDVRASADKDEHADPSVQETITQMQQLAREKAAQPKKRWFSFKSAS
jgi:hypothetical protein